MQAKWQQPIFMVFHTLTSLAAITVRCTTIRLSLLISIVLGSFKSLCLSQQELSRGRRNVRVGIGLIVKCLMISMTAYDMTYHYCRAFFRVHHRIAVFHFSCQLNKKKSFNPYLNITKLCSISYSGSIDIETKIMNCEIKALHHISEPNSTNRKMCSKFKSANVAKFNEK